MKWKINTILTSVFFFSWSMLWGQLHIEGAFYIDGAAEVSVWNDLEIASANGLLINAGILEVEGNWNKSSESTYQGATSNTDLQLVIFRNDDFRTDADQRITGDMTGDQAFQNLEIDNTGDNRVVDLAANIEVKGQLQFSNGRIRTDVMSHGDDGAAYSYELFVSNTDPTAIVGHSMMGGASSKFVEGKLRRAFMGMDRLYEFPVGIFSGSEPFEVRTGGPFPANSLLSYFQLGANTGLGSIQVCDVGTGGTNSDPFTPDGVDDVLEIDCVVGQWNISAAGTAPFSYDIRFFPSDDLRNSCIDALYWYVAQDAELENCPDRSGVMGIGREGLLGFTIFDLASASEASTVLSTHLEYIDGNDPRAKLFPNPNQGSIVNLTIAGELFDNSDGTLNVFNALGQKVYERKVIIDRNANYWQIDISSWPSGTYEVRLRNDTQFLTKTLMISS